MKLLRTSVCLYLCLCQSVYADFNTGDTFGKGIVVQASGTTVTGGGRTLNFGQGVGVSVSNNKFNVSASSGIPAGGSNTQVQYNNANAFGGISNVTSDGTNLTKLGMAEASNLIFGTATGTSIATTTSQKLAFWGSAPTVRPSGNICTSMQNIGLLSSCTESGGVTSVTFTGDNIIDSSTPSTAVTTSGTLTATPLTQAKNTVLAGPTTGAAVNPTFRALVGADLPNPSSTTLGGTQSLASVASKWINTISTSGVPSATQPSDSDIAFTDITTGNSSTSNHGYLLKLNNSATQFMNGQGAWATPFASATSITVGTTTVASGTNTYVEYNNAGTLGEYPISGSGNVCMSTSCVMTTPTLGVASSTSLATSAASPLLLTNGKLVTIALTSQTINPVTLTIPNFASVNDTFTFNTLASTLANKTLTTPIISTGLSASGSAANDFSGSTGTFLTSSGANTLNGTVTITPPVRTSGVASYFTLNIPSDTGQTAATEAIGYQHVTANRTWATTGTVALQRENFFAGPTYKSAAASQTFTDAFTLYATPPIAGLNAIFTRGHTLGIVDSTDAASAVTGALVIANTLGTASTSVGIGAGDIYAGNNGFFGGTLGATGHETFEGVTSTGATGTGKFVFDASPTLTGTPILPTPYTIGAVSMTSTGTQLNYLNAATGTTGTTSTNVVFSTSPTFITPTLGAAAATSLTTTGNAALGGLAIPAYFTNIRGVIVGESGATGLDISHNDNIGVGNLAVNAVQTGGNGDSTGWKYVNSTTALRFSELYTGVFRWQTAISGTAGNAITWVNIMALTGTGLGLGTVTAPTSQVQTSGTCGAIGPVGACWTSTGQLGYCSGATGVCTTCTSC